MVSLENLFFSGEDPEGWLSEIESFLDRLLVSMDNYVEIALCYLRGAAASWATKNASLISHMDWCAFSYHLLCEFSVREGNLSQNKVEVLPFQSTEVLAPSQEDTGNFSSLMVIEEGTLSVIVGDDKNSTEESPNLDSQATANAMVVAGDNEEYTGINTFLGLDEYRKSSMNPVLVRNYAFKWSEYKAESKIKYPDKAHREFDQMNERDIFISLSVIFRVFDHWYLQFDGGGFTESTPLSNITKDQLWKSPISIKHCPVIGSLYKNGQASIEKKEDKKVLLSFDPGISSISATVYINVTNSELNVFAFDCLKYRIDEHNAGEGTTDMVFTSEMLQFYLHISWASLRMEVFIVTGYLNFYVRRHWWEISRFLSAVGIETMNVLIYSLRGLQLFIAFAECHEVWGSCFVDMHGSLITHVYECHVPHLSIEHFCAYRIAPRCRTFKELLPDMLKVMDFLVSSSNKTSIMDYIRCSECQQKMVVQLNTTASHVKVFLCVAVNTGLLFLLCFTTPCFMFIDPKVFVYPFVKPSYSKIMWEHKMRNNWLICEFTSAISQDDGNEEQAHIMTGWSFTGIKLHKVLSGVELNWFYSLVVLWSSTTEFSASGLDLDSMGESCQNTELWNAFTVCIKQLDIQVVPGSVSSGLETKDSKSVRCSVIRCYPITKMVNWVFSCCFKSLQRSPPSAFYPCMHTNGFYIRVYMTAMGENMGPAKGIMLDQLILFAVQTHAFKCRASEYWFSVDASFLQSYRVHCDIVRSSQRVSKVSSMNEFRRVAIVKGVWRLYKASKGCFSFMWNWFCRLPCPRDLLYAFIAFKGGTICVSHMTSASKVSASDEVRAKAICTVSTSFRVHHIVLKVNCWSPLALDLDKQGYWCFIFSTKFYVKISHKHTSIRLHKVWQELEPKLLGGLVVLLTDNNFNRVQFDADMGALYNLQELQFIASISKGCQSYKGEVLQSMALYSTMVRPYAISIGLLESYPRSATTRVYIQIFIQNYIRESQPNRGSCTDNYTSACEDSLFLTNFWDASARISLTESCCIFARKYANYRRYRRRLYTAWLLRTGMFEIVSLIAFQGVISVKPQQGNGSLIEACDGYLLQLFSLILEASSAWDVGEVNWLAMLQGSYLLQYCPGSTLDVSRMCHMTYGAYVHIIVDLKVSFIQIEALWKFSTGCTRDITDVLEESGHLLWHFRHHCYLGRLLALVLVYP